MTEIAVRYKATFQTVSSFFSNDQEMAKNEVYEIIDSFEDIPYQIYDVENNNGIISAHFHIYYPEKDHCNKKFIEFLSKKTALINVEILDIRVDEI